MQNLTITKLKVWSWN